MSIARKVLIVVTAISLGALLLLSAISIASILAIRKTTLELSNNLVNEAMQESQQTIESQIKWNLMNLANDKAALIDGPFKNIRNQTRMTAMIAGNIYTNPDLYKPRDIDYLPPEEEGSTVTHILSAPGVRYRDIQDEARLAANISDILQQDISLDLGLTAAYIGSDSGFMIVADKFSTSQNSHTFDVTKRSWFVGAKERGDMFWTEIFLDAAGRGESISCAMPFYDRSGPEPVFKGVAACASLLSNVRNIIENSGKLGETGYVFLVNDSGRLVLDPASEILANSALFTGDGYLNNEIEGVRELSDHMVNRESGFMKIDLRGNYVYVAFEPLSSIDLSMGLVLDANEINEVVQQMRGNILEYTKNDIARIDNGFFIMLILIAFVMLVTASATAFIGRRLSRSLTAPILRLHEEAEIISGGDLNHTLSIDSDDEIGRLANTFNTMIHSIQNITSEKERMNSEINLAAEIQNNLLPQISPKFSRNKHFELFAKMVPAKQVGGDFYDFYYLNEDQTKLAFLIADVSGKGVPAALFTVMAKGLFKLNLMNGCDPATVLSIVNKILCDDNPNSMFVTAFVCVINLKTGRLTYANGGHTPPLISLSGRPYKFMNLKPNILVGIYNKANYTLCGINLQAGDKIYLYTDGVNETFDKDMNEFGNERFLEKANIYRYLPPEEFDRAIRHELEVFMNGAEQSDDITTLALTYLGNREDVPSNNSIFELKTPDTVEDSSFAADEIMLYEFETSISVPASVDSLDILSNWMENILQSYSCSDLIYNQIMMASEEIFVNIAMYAYPKTGGDVIVRVVKKGNSLILEYEDEGVPFNPLEVPPPDTSIPPEDRHIGGLGIYLTRKIMDDVKYRNINGKNKLTLYKFID
ncbi:MAG: SpoIIE family protein phosphatase [Spirochaetaceae bacterium]|jgi:sigma-B regulation protein RsbU (phosphoserine phosphatase)|nr:SpoIIE family protein phosphatase [Spirochaetaceae bacterium]